jgi:hypothetical protein
MSINSITGIAILAVITVSSYASAEETLWRLSPENSASHGIATTISRVRHEETQLLVSISISKHTKHLELAHARLMSENLGIPLRVEENANGIRTISFSMSSKLLSQSRVSLWDGASQLNHGTYVIDLKLFLTDDTVKNKKQNKSLDATSL